MLYRLVVAYLCVFFIFPTQVWSDPTPRNPVPVNDGSKTAPAAVIAPVANDENVAAKPDEDFRKELRLKMHMASWQLAAIVRDQIPEVAKIKETEYYSLIAPYMHCASPFNTIPDDITKIKKEVMGTVQEAFAKFWMAHQDEIGVSAGHGEEEDEAENAKTIVSQTDVVFSEDGKTQCLASALREEPSTTTHSAQSVYRFIKRIQQTKQEFRRPQYNSLSLLRGKQPINDLEVRRWVTWLFQLRDTFRTLAKFYAYKNDEPNPTLAPPLVVPKSLAQLFNQTFTLSLDNKINKDKAKRISQAIMDGASIATTPSIKRAKKSTDDPEYKQEDSSKDVLIRLPGFSACAPNEVPKNWDFIKGTPNCFRDGTERVGVVSDEDIFNTYHAKKGPGAEFNTIRKLAIRELETEWAALITLRGGPARTLPAACLAAGDLKEQRNYFEQITSFDNQRLRVQTFVRAVNRLASAYISREIAIPIPGEAFQNLAQSFSHQWVDAYFQKNSYKVESRTRFQPLGIDSLFKTGADVVEQVPELVQKGNVAPEIKPVGVEEVSGAQKRIRESLAALPFSTRFLEGDRNGGSDYITLLAEELVTWFRLVSDQVSQLPKENRVLVLNDMVSRLIQIVLTKTEENFAVSKFRGEGLDLAEVMQPWRETFQVQFNKAMGQSPFKQDLDRMAETITATLLDLVDKAPELDVTQMADRALTEYVRAVSPNARHAAETVEMLRRTTPLAKRADGAVLDPFNSVVPFNLPLIPFNFVSREAMPTPSNFHWDSTRRMSRQEFDRQAPYYLQLNEAEGKGYLMELPNPHTTEGFAVILGSTQTRIRRTDCANFIVDS
jgi:hypothetical protein